MAPGLSHVKMLMGNTRLYVIIVAMFLSGFACKGQKLWINALPMGYNPSFAGSANSLRLASNSSMGLESYSNSTSNSIQIQNTLSADKFVSAINSGLGVTFKYGYYVSKFKSLTSAKNFFFEESIVLAPKFSSKGRYTFSPSLQFTNFHEYGKYYNIVYSTDQDYSAQEIIYHKQHYNLRAGLLFNTQKFFAGLSMVLLKKDEELPMVRNNPMYLMAGYTFRKIENSDFSFSPVLLITNNKYYFNGQGNFVVYDFYSDGIHMAYSPRFGEFSLNLYLALRYKKFTTGFDLDRNFMAGFESKKCKIMLIQNLKCLDNILGLTEEFVTFYSAQLSLRYIWADHTKIN